ncbi:hypothetical protein ROZALSC1DRAFT_26782 [Rozella allomycis CSF55]|uniref:Thioredoxin-like fold domain-containing protein n=1 Tax=Rozella allomycis (strain CSF55) TaxID=988480 RepID=A0A075B152_ROZAC|nr:Thioredoxin-like fold domain-containing protein [Rozella allomycis CSF55]RKP21816.1 hypothetical protein ROZALSC1DRAFT_26782 [Rozella allomycis CSF55]|eukprot:EPZ34556.1 Thioredoxin-like fold domain-containing protein [Rozella allomycis CSF55]
MDSDTYDENFERFEEERMTGSGSRGSNRSRRHQQDPEPIFSSFRNIVEENTLSVNGTRPGTLSDLFRPPLELLFPGTFEQARQKAKDRELWLLIDLQNPNEFVCNTLNRDLWNDPLIKNYLRENFIFVQYSAESSEGRRYQNYYPVENYPHVAIIEPKTGERIKFFKNKVEPLDFIQDCTEAFDRYTIQMTPAIPLNENNEVPLQTEANDETFVKAIVGSLDPKDAEEIDKNEKNCTRIQFRSPG